MQVKVQLQKKRKNSCRMEKMWRKFSTGQVSSSAGGGGAPAVGASDATTSGKGKKKVPLSETGTISSAGGFGFGEPANVAAVPARQIPDDSSVHDMIGIEKRRRRRRKSRPKRNG